MDFNYRNAHVALVLEDVALTLQDADVKSSDLTLIGVTSSESGYKIEKDQVQRSSTGKEYVLTWKLTINLPVLTTIPAQLQKAIDGKMARVCFIDRTKLDFEDGASAIPVPETPMGINDAGLILAPTKLWITEDEQFGTGQVRAIVIVGEEIASQKSDLRKSFNLELA